MLLKVMYMSIRELGTPQRFFQDGGGSRKVSRYITEIIQNEC